MINQDIAKIFSEMSALLEMLGAAFKPQAYERAAVSIENLGDDLAEIYKKGGVRALEEIPGIGKSMAEMIKEFIKSKHIKEYESLKKEIPVDIENLSKVGGVGPKGL